MTWAAFPSSVPQVPRSLFPFTTKIKGTNHIDHSALVMTDERSGERERWVIHRERGRGKKHGCFCLCTACSWCICLIRSKCNCTKFTNYTEGVHMHCEAAESGEQVQFLIWTRFINTRSDSSQWLEGVCTFILTQRRWFRQKRGDKNSGGMGGRWKRGRKRCKINTRVHTRMCSLCLSFPVDFT